MKQRDETECGIVVPDAVATPPTWQEQDDIEHLGRHAFLVIDVPSMPLTLALTHPELARFTRLLHHRLLPASVSTCPT